MAKIFGINTEEILHLLILFLTGKHALRENSYRSKNNNATKSKPDTIRNGLWSWLNRDKTSQAQTAIALTKTIQPKNKTESKEFYKVRIKLHTLEPWEIRSYLKTTREIIKLGGYDAHRRVLTEINNQLKLIKGKHIRKICQELFLIEKNPPWLAHKLHTVLNYAESAASHMAKSIDRYANTIDRWVNNAATARQMRTKKYKDLEQRYAHIAHRYIGIPIVAFAISVIIYMVYRIIKTGHILITVPIIIVCVILVALLRWQEKQNSKIF